MMKSSVLLELLPQMPLCWYGSNRGGDIPTDPGAYVLEISLNQAVQFSVSRLGNQLLPPGRYFYVGSARGPGGLGGRLKRHFMPDKTLHWHVDHLTSRASELGAYVLIGANECDLVKTLLDSGCFETPLDGFGSTDCARCRSHLLKLQNPSFPAYQPNINRP